MGVWKDIILEKGEGKTFALESAERLFKEGEVSDIKCFCPQWFQLEYFHE